MSEFNTTSIAEIRKWTIEVLGTNQFWHLGMELFLLRNAHCVRDEEPEIEVRGFCSLLCTMGHCRATLNEHPIELSAHKGLIVMHGDVLRFMDHSHDFLFDCIIMSRAFCESLQVGNQLTVLMQVPEVMLVDYTDEDWSLLMLYTDMLQRTLMQTDNPHREQMVRHLMSARHFASVSVRWNQSQQADRKSDLATRFVQLLQLEYLRHHDIAFYAERLGATPKYLSESVKKATGRTAGQWIDNALLRDAEHLLTTTALPVQEIGYRLGFEDQSLFGKFFKRLKNLSPRAFREQQGV